MSSPNPISIPSLAALTLSAVLSASELEFFETQLAESLHRIDEQEASRIREVCEWATAERQAAHRRVLLSVLGVSASLGTCLPTPEPLPSVSEPMPDSEPMPETEGSSVVPVEEEPSEPVSVAVVVEEVPITHQEPEQVTKSVIQSGIPEGHLTTTEVANRIGVKNASVIRWAKEGIITPAGKFRPAGASILAFYFTPDVIEKIIEYRSGIDARRAAGVRASISKLTPEQLSARTRNARTPKNVPEGYISLADAGAIIGKTDDLVRHLVKQGKVESIAIGSRRYVSEASVREHLRLTTVPKVTTPEAPAPEKLEKAVEPVKAVEPEPETVTIAGVELVASTRPDHGKKTAASTKAAARPRAAAVKAPKPKDLTAPKRASVAPKKTPPAPAPAKVSPAGLDASVSVGFEPELSRASNLKGTLAHWGTLMNQLLDLHWKTFLLGGNSVTGALVMQRTGPLPEGFVQVAAGDLSAGRWAVSVPMTARGWVSELGYKVKDHLMGIRKSGGEL